MPLWILHLKSKKKEVLLQQIGVVVIVASCEYQNKELRITFYLLRAQNLFYELS